MIRLVTEQDRARVLSLCRKDAWDGTELLAAYSARCADKGGVDWRRCDLWIGESETQKKNIQYLLCRVGENYRLVGAPRSPTRWEELHAFLQLQPAGTLTAREEVVDEYCRRFSPEGQERAPGRHKDALPAHPQRHHRQRGDRVPEPVGNLRRAALPEAGAVTAGQPGRVHRPHALFKAGRRALF